MTITFYTFLFATLATVFFVDVPDIADKISAAPMTGVYGGFMILFVTLFPYLCYTKGLSGLENTTASVIASIEPVVATVLGVIIYGETPNPITFLGIVCVLGSIVILNKKERKGLVIWKEK